MKTLKYVMQVALAVSMICMFNSCSGGSSSQQEAFWEGKVKPGTYTSCTSNNSSSNNSKSSKYDRTPFAVYVYDNDKEIVLYENPNTATVNGKSGSWTSGGQWRESSTLEEAAMGGVWKQVYTVRYGSETLVISPGEELVFFGSVEQAKQG